jgi:phosphatidylinositol alpha-mannosyltransferase
MFRGGGVQEYVMALRSGFVARGHKAFIITPQPRDYKGPKVPGMIMIGSATSFRAARTEGAISASIDVNALDQMLESHHFDILHFHEPWNPMLSRQILTRSHAIHFGTFHAAMGERRTSRTVEKVITPYTKSILGYLDVLTAVSPTATKYVKTLTNRSIYIIPNGIEIEKFQKKQNNPHPSKTKTILYVGRLEKRKAVKYLLEAFSLVHSIHKDYKLLIVGEGPEKENLQQQCKEQKITNVKFLGFVDNAEKIRLMQSSEIFCSPAMYGESFGIVLLEAMASGCVVVAGNNPGYESVMTGTGQMSLINPRDTKEFARRILLLASDKGLRQHWLDWAENEVQKYSYLNIVDQYIKLYETAYNKKHNL